MADFLIIGSPVDHLEDPGTRVRLVTGRGLSRAEIDVQYEQFPWLLDASDQLPALRTAGYRVSGSVQDLRIIEAPDYGAALTALDGLWQGNPPVTRLAPLLGRRHAVACPGPRCWYADVEGYPRCEPGQCVRLLDGAG